MAVIETGREGAVSTITLTRPNVFNALNRELMDAVADALGQAARDDTVRAVVITGAGASFCSGADIAELDGVDLVHVLHPDGFPGPMFDRLSTFAKPVIAAVNGAALGGGCELALACDTVVAAESARFGLPEVSLGLIPGAGGTQRLIEALGKAKAMKMLLSGLALTSREAEAAGLVAQVVDDDQVLDAAMQLGQRIARNAPLAVQLAKDAALASTNGNTQSGLDRERRNFFLALATEDRREGVDAFLAKRRPRFDGR
ncbi:enoyl-CoA hydratase-related protein [Janibacter sp. G1551]|uniref:enoyl-CoA hydratase-related protein n=1 Tax=Janibacter sp. G1551 TaxID=3420440 RepID=UPI002F182F31